MDRITDFGHSTYPDKVGAAAARRTKVPDHLLSFGPETISLLPQPCGFRIEAIQNVLASGIRKPRMVKLMGVMGI